MPQTAVKSLQLRTTLTDQMLHPRFEKWNATICAKQTESLHFPICRHKTELSIEKKGVNGHPPPRMLVTTRKTTF